MTPFVFLWTLHSHAMSRCVIRHKNISKKLVRDAINQLPNQLFIASLLICDMRIIWSHFSFLMRFFSFTICWEELCAAVCMKLLCETVNIFIAFSSLYSYNFHFFYFLGVCLVSMDGILLKFTGKTAYIMAGRGLSRKRSLIPFTRI